MPQYDQVTIGDPLLVIFEFMANGSLFGYLTDVCLIALSISCLTAVRSLLAILTAA